MNEFPVTEMNEWVIRMDNQQKNNETIAAICLANLAGGNWWTGEIEWIDFRI